MLTVLNVLLGLLLVGWGVVYVGARPAGAGSAGGWRAWRLTDPSTLRMLLVRRRAELSARYAWCCGAFLITAGLGLVAWAVIA